MMITSRPEPQAALKAGNDLCHVEAALGNLSERTRQIFRRVGGQARPWQLPGQRPASGVECVAGSVGLERHEVLGRMIVVR